MDRTERFYLIDQLLQQRRSTSMDLLMDELGVSRSTVKRDLAYMRDRFYAPIIWDARWEGYRYADSGHGMRRFSLPGLWFNSSELHALLTMEHLLQNLQPNLLGKHVVALRKRVRNLLEQGDHSVEHLARRIRILHNPSPQVDATIFQNTASAVLDRVQIFASHLNRATNETNDRNISPQRLVYYNESWYLDGWCHLREGLRTFRLSNLTCANLTEQRAIEIDDEELDAQLSVGFGIFGGKETRQAKLKFSSAISPWVTHEKWHSNQSTQLDKSGELLMTFPYSNDPELIMRILRYGPDVEVLEPAGLRDKISSRLHEAAIIYDR